MNKVAVFSVHDLKFTLEADLDFKQHEPTHIGLVGKGLMRSLLLVGEPNGTLSYAGVRGLQPN